MLSAVRKILPTLFAACAFLAVSVHAQKNSGSPILKVAEIEMRQARQSAALVAMGDYLYIFGGSGGGAPIYEAERLDVRTGRTETLPGKFLARRGHGAFEHNGKIYLVGGEGYSLPGRAHETTIECYDPATGEVKQMGQMPRPRARFGTVKIGNEAWLIGGTKVKDERSYAQTNEVEILDLDTLQWRQGPPMPTPRDAPVVVVGAFAVVAGGYARRTALDDVELYVPAENVWKRLPRLSRTASTHSAAFLGRWLFLFGDYELGDQVLAYELSTRKTTKIDPNYRNARRTAAATIGDRIYVVGGSVVETGSVNSGRRSGMVMDAGSERAVIQVFALNPDYRAP